MKDLLRPSQHEEVCDMLMSNDKGGEQSWLPRVFRSPLPYESLTKDWEIPELPENNHDNLFTFWKKIGI